MKIPCPFCTEDIPYDPALAGKTVQCSYCKQALLIPPVAQLSAGISRGIPGGARKILRKQEAQQLKEERRWQKEQQREQERLLEAEQEAGREMWDAAVAAVQQDVPEDGIVANSYPVLRSLVRLYRVVSIVVGALAVVGVAISLAVAFKNRDATAILSAVGIVVFAAASILMLSLAAEAISLFVNMANDIRVSKALLKRMAYRLRNQVPPRGDDR